MKPKDCFVSCFEGVVCHAGDSEGAGAWGSWSHCIHSHGAQTPALEVMPPTFRMDPLQLPFWRHPHRHSQRGVSITTLHPIKLTMRSSHSTHVSTSTGVAFPIAAEGRAESCRSPGRLNLSPLERRYLSSVLPRAHQTPLTISLLGLSVSTVMFPDWHNMEGE